MKAVKQRRAPTQRPGEILDAALALFVEKGFAATRLDDVAERAGLSKAAIYLYFEDKTALFQGVVRQAVAVNLGTVAAMVNAHRGPVAPLLPRILEFMASRIEETPMAAVAKLVIAESRAFPEIGRFYLKEVIGRGIPMLEGLIVRGIAQGEFRRVDPGPDGALDHGRHAAGRPVAHGVRADRRGETRRQGARPPPRRPDVARVEARDGPGESWCVMKAPPKRAIFIVLVVLIATGLVTRGYWQQPLLGLLGIEGDDGRYLGYVEGETSLIAPPVAGQLLERPVDRGGHVRKGDRLFVIDPTLARSEVARAEAALAETKARHENLLTGKRPEEQDVVRAQRREAEASLAMAELELKRQTELLPRASRHARPTIRPNRRSISCAHGSPRWRRRSASATCPRARPRSRRRLR